MCVGVHACACAHIQPHAHAHTSTVLVALGLAPSTGHHVCSSQKAPLHVPPPSAHVSLSSSPKQLAPSRAPPLHAPIRPISPPPASAAMSCPSLMHAPVCMPWNVCMPCWHCPPSLVHFSVHAPLSFFEWLCAPSEHRPCVCSVMANRVGMKKPSAWYRTRSSASHACDCTHRTQKRQRVPRQARARAQRTLCARAAPAARRGRTASAASRLAASLAEPLSLVCTVPMSWSTFW